jgi:toxin HigB-1
MIKDFACKNTDTLFNTGKSAKFPSEIIKTALRKLDYLNAAVNIEALRVLPGNRLEKLDGNLVGFYSIRVNDQWRLVFKFEDTHAHEVQIMDYQ